MAVQVNLSHNGTAIATLDKDNTAKTLKTANKLVTENIDVTLSGCPSGNLTSVTESVVDNKYLIAVVESNSFTVCRYLTINTADYSTLNFEDISYTRSTGNNNVAIFGVVRNCEHVATMTNEAYSAVFNGVTNILSMSNYEATTKTLDSYSYSISESSSSLAIGFCTSCFNVYANNTTSQIKNIWLE